MMNKKQFSTFDEPLSEQDLDELADFLDDVPDAMTLEAMDGFLAAIACSPKIIMPGEFLMHILGEEHAFKEAGQAEKYAGLILRRWNSIIGQLENNDFFEPILLEYDDGLTGNEWAIGFLSGVQLGEEHWEELLEDEEQSDLFVPVFLLAHENSPDPEMRPEPIDPEKREKILALLTFTIPRIYKYLAEDRAAYAESHRKSATFERPARKIGRNEPCPCGSGKKFKKCCSGD